MAPILLALRRRINLTSVLVVALIVRVLAGYVVQSYVAGKGLLCVFGDTPIYWLLARTIRLGQTFVVEQQFDIPHYALRTPGYPAFLAGCQVIFGENPLAIRIVQALLQTVAVGLVYRLVRQVRPDAPKSVGLVAAAMVAVDPYVITASALLLSEGTFIPLMMIMLCGLATLWGAEPSRRPRGWLAGLVGVVGGLAILSRPSWLLFMPVPLTVWILTSRQCAIAARYSFLILLGVVIVLCPWWVRNAKILGKFVPTALWVGASLYDGLSPTADGSSAMEFLNEPQIARLDEIDQDTELRRRSIEFIWANPQRVEWLAVVKFARYWSPWPNASAFTSPFVSTVSAVITLPVFACMGLGAWSLRGDLRALTLFGGPIVYFCCLHMIFVSSVRYRVPGLLPAMGLAAIGAHSVWMWTKKLT